MLSGTKTDAVCHQTAVPVTHSQTVRQDMNETKNKEIVRCPDINP